MRKPRPFGQGSHIGESRKKSGGSLNLGDFFLDLQRLVRQLVVLRFGEEAIEAVMAAVQNDRENLVYESADLLYHLLVLLKSRNLTLEQVVGELASRHGARVPGSL